MKISNCKPQFLGYNKSQPQKFGQSMPSNLLAKRSEYK